MQSRREKQTAVNSRPIMHDVAKSEKLIFRQLSNSAGGNFDDRSYLIRNSAIAEGPRDALYQLKSCLLWHSCTNK